MPIWAELVRAIPHQITGGEFVIPPGIEERTICAQDGFPARGGQCGETMTEWFLADNLPEDSALFYQSDASFERLMERFTGVVDDE